ncbi:MAG: hypothetical protein ACPHRO_00300 [Nannocystaceae bacterium]
MGSLEQLRDGVRLSLSRGVLPATLLVIISASGCGGSGRALSTGQSSGSGTSEGETASAGSTASDEGGDAGDMGSDPILECTEDQDCVLYDDCCDCMPLHVDERWPPGCPIDCFESYCESFGVSEVTCAGGVCDFVRAPCDPLEVVCDALPPDCDEGTLPGVESGCWSGLCIPVKLCDVVPSCSRCGYSEVCLEIFAIDGPRFSCRPRPSWCEYPVDCACGASLCDPIYDRCTDIAPNHLYCSATP